MYLLDTDVIIYYLRKKIPQDERIFYESYISRFTQAELIYGAYKSGDKDRQMLLVSDFINNFNIQRIELTDDVVHEFCKTKASLEKKGEKLADFDLFIAATAIVNNLTLVTNNKNHFERIKGLKIY